MSPESDRVAFLHKALQDAGIHPIHVENPIVGAIIGSWLSTGVKPKEIKRFLNIFVDSVAAEIIEACKAEGHDPPFTI